MPTADELYSIKFFDKQNASAIGGIPGSEAMCVSSGDDAYFSMNTTRIHITRPVDKMPNIIIKNVFKCADPGILVLFPAFESPAMMISRHPKAEIPKKSPGTPRIFARAVNKE